MPAATDEPASLPGLPLEIMEFVVEHMVDSVAEGSLAALAATCRGLHAIVMPRLYNKQMAERHPALIFWAAQLGRFDTAQRLIEAGVDLNRVMIRNESMSEVLRRTAEFTPRQIYQDLRVINDHIGPHDVVPRVGARGFVTEPYRLPDQNVGVIPMLTGHWRCWWFPLHLAVSGGFSDLVDLFISHGAILQAPSASFCTCKHFSMVANSRFPTTRTGWTALHTAICNGHIEIAKTLLRRGAPVSVSLELDRVSPPFTVLHNAAAAGSTELVDFIFDNQYQTAVQVVDLHELSPLWHAYLRKHWDAVDALLKRGADINDDLAAGYTPLTDACLFGDFSSALELVTRGADVNVICTAYPNSYDRVRWPTMEHLECLRGHRPIDLCCSNQQKLTRSIRYSKLPPGARFSHPLGFPLAAPLHTVPVPDETSRTELVRALLDAGANLGPCKHSPYGVPPLVAAAAEHLVDIVRMLLDHGAEVDCTDKDGNTPLMAAMNYSLHWCSSHAKVGPLSTRPFALLRPNRVVTHRPESCRQNGDFIACVQLLIERGAKVTATNDSGASPLSLVYSPIPLPGRRYRSDRPRVHLTFKERAVIVSMLLDLGADPNTAVDIVAQEDSSSDLDSDNSLIFSDSDSDTNLDTPAGSDRASSGGPPKQMRLRSLYKYGRLSVLQCAFWDGDLDLCRLLLKRGAELSTRIVAWILHITCTYCRYRMSSAAHQALQLLGDLEVDVQTRLGSHPACLYALINQHVANQQIRSMAADILQTNIDMEKFKEIPDDGYDWLISRRGSVSWGSACLSAAIRNGLRPTVESLLQLGVDINGPDVSPNETPLMLAVDEEDAEMVELLIQHGATIKIDGGNESEVFAFGDKSYPLVQAIAGEQPNIISAILRGQEEPLSDKFAYAYIREAYMRRSPKSLSCLLTFLCLNPHARSPGEGNTHLIDVMQNISPICTFSGSATSGFGTVLWSITIRLKLKQVCGWIDCLILLAQAGISPIARNDAGVSALDLFGEIINYKGSDRFKTHVRSALRSRLNEVMGEELLTDFLSAETAFNALTQCEVDFTGSQASSVSRDDGD